MERERVKGWRRSEGGRKERGKKGRKREEEGRE